MNKKYNTFNDINCNTNNVEIENFESIKVKAKKMYAEIDPKLTKIAEEYLNEWRNMRFEIIKMTENFVSKIRNLKGYEVTGMAVAIALLSDGAIETIEFYGKGVRLEDNDIEDFEPNDVYEYYIECNMRDDNTYIMNVISILDYKDLKDWDEPVFDTIEY